MGAMWTCPQCGQENDSSLHDCSNCGRRKDGVAPSPDPGKRAPDASARRPKSVRGCVIVFGIFGLVAALVVAVAVPAWLRLRREGSEQNASAVLKMIAVAQGDFRSNDRDRNVVNDFWTGDVAGLYCIEPQVGDLAYPEPIRLIDLSTAGADSDPLRAPGKPYLRSISDFTVPRQKAGYWYWALRHDRSVNPPEPYQTDTGGTPSAGKFTNARRFGVLGYPDVPGQSGDAVFIISEKHTVYRRPAPDTIDPSDREPPGAVTEPGFTSWPSDAELMFGWKRMD